MRSPNEMNLIAALFKSRIFAETRTLMKRDSFNSVLKQATLSCGLGILVLSNFCLADAEFLRTPPSVATYADCAQISSANAKTFSRIAREHEACLSAGRFESGSEPCSRHQCRPLHLKMHEFDRESKAINQRCLGSARSNTEARYSEQSIVRYMNGLSALEDSISKVKTTLAVLENPRSILTAAFGSGEDDIRKKISAKMAKGMSRNDQDAIVMSYVIDRARGIVEVGIKNPLARSLDATSLDIIFNVYAKSLSDFNDSLKQVDGSMSAFSAIPLSPLDSTPRMPSRRTDPDCGPGCIRRN